MKSEFWQKFLAESGRGAETKYSWSVSFGMSREAADRAAEKVCSGEKTAMIYPENGYRTNMSAPAAPGDLHLVCDWQQKPRAVLELVSVEKFSLRELSDDHCRREAEAEDRESWMQQRLPAVKTEIEELGGELTDDSILICENFRVIYAGE